KTLHAGATRAGVGAGGRRGHRAHSRDQAAEISGGKCRGAQRATHGGGSGADRRGGAAWRGGGAAVSGSDDGVGQSLSFQDPNEGNQPINHEGNSRTSIWRSRGFEAGGSAHAESRPGAG